MEKANQKKPEQASILKPPAPKKKRASGPSICYTAYGRNCAQAQAS